MSEDTSLVPQHAVPSLDAIMGAASQSALATTHEYSNTPITYIKIVGNGASKPTYPAGYHKEVYTKSGSSRVDFSGKTVTEPIQLSIPNIEGQRTIVYADSIQILFATMPVDQRIVYHPMDDAEGGVLCKSNDGISPQSNFIGKEAVHTKLGSRFQIPTLCKDCPASKFIEGAGSMCSQSVAIPVLLLSYTVGETDGFTYPVNQVALIQSGRSEAVRRSIVGAQKGRYFDLGKAPFKSLFLPTRTQQGADGKDYNITPVSPTPGSLHPINVSSKLFKDPRGNIIVFDFKVAPEALDEEGIKNFQGFHVFFNEREIFKQITNNTFNFTPDITIDTDASSNDDPF